MIKFFTIGWFIAFALKANEPKFVLGVFATYRSRAELIDTANKQNIYSYNINWTSKVDFANNCIKNAWVRAGSKWYRLNKVPLPHVVYDFGVYKGAKKKKAKANIIRQDLRNAGVLFINPEEAMIAVNDKLMFAKVMQKNNISHPKTYKYSYWNLQKMIKNNNLLFLKPSLGSKGYGIIILQKNSKNSFSLKYKISNDNDEWNSIVIENIVKKNLIKTIKQVKTQLKTNNADYIIQQGIDVFKYTDGQNNNHQTDFRVNVQRDFNNKLSSTGLMMRVGGNLSQGGRPAYYKAVLKSLENFGFVIDDIKEKVVQLAIDTHLALEKHSKQQIGDLGMDVVIDNDGNPYVIEANTKSGYPSKYIENNPILETLYDLPPALELCKIKDQEHEQHIIDYAYYLVNNHSSSCK